MKKITVLTRIEALVWEDDAVDVIGAGLRKCGVRCVVCGNQADNPRDIVLTSPCDFDDVANVLPEGVYIRFHIVTLQDSPEAQEFFQLLFKWTGTYNGN